MIDASPLRMRFESFVKTLEGYENVDELLSRSFKIENRKRADYFFKDRHIIVEQKELVSDPLEKTQRAAEQIMRERGVIPYGSLPIKKVFSGQPDADLIHKRILQKLTKTIADDIANADKQTRDTRLIFDLPDAVGILVFLNETAKLLTPDIAQFAIRTALQKRGQDGRPRYSQNKGAIMISEAHTLALPRPHRAYPIATFVDRMGSHGERVGSFLDTMAEKWAAFNRALLIEGTDCSLSSFN